MNKPITVGQLYQLCKKEIMKGNADKVIMISQDDEGNGYHYLWYAFQTVKEYEQPVTYQHKMFVSKFEWADERVASKEDTIILG